MHFLLGIVAMDIRRMASSLEYQASEHGSDCLFGSLPKAAQEEALRIIEYVESSGDTNKANLLTRMLDVSIDFRDAIGLTNMDIYPKQVDTVQRFYKFWKQRYA